MLAFEFGNCEFFLVSALVSRFVGGDAREARTCEENSCHRNICGGHAGRLIEADCLTMHEAEEGQDPAGGREGAGLPEITFDNERLLWPLESGPRESSLLPSLRGPGA